MKELYKIMRNVCWKSISVWAIFCLGSLIVGRIIDSNEWIHMGLMVGYTGITPVTIMRIMVSEFETRLHKMEESEEDKA